MAVHLRARDGAIAVPPVGLGCWSWGDDKRVWGWNSYDKSLSPQSVAAAFEAAVDAGVRLFDTAETYGSGLSEEILGKLVSKHPLRDELLVATKWQPGKWAPTGMPVKDAMLAAARESLGRLGIDQLTLFQIRAPLHPASMKDQGEGLAAVVEAGLARAVGVSNFSAEQVREVHAALSARGIPLATNQVEFSILRQLPRTNQSGLMAACAELGVTLLAYSPLAMGRLTGKYTPRNPPQGRRGFSAYPMRDIQTVLEVLEEVAAEHGCTPSQAALAWCVAHGAVPIPGAKNAAQARENAGALALVLAPSAVARLDRAGRNGGTSRWQHG